MENNNIKKQNTYTSEEEKTLNWNEIQTLFAKIIKDQEIVKEVKLLYNPISGYYFSSVQLKNTGDYLINIMNGVKLVDTINVNLYD